MVASPEEASGPVPSQPGGSVLPRGLGGVGSGAERR